MTLARAISRLSAAAEGGLPELQRLALPRNAAVRRVTLALALVIFAGGAFWSLRKLSISPRDVDPGPLALLALLTLPSLIYGGIGLNLLARSSRLSLPIGRSTVLAAYGYLAELLPLPGGAIVRAGALMKAGGDLKRSSALVILTAVLWIALGMIGAGLTLLTDQWRLALPLLVAGTLLSGAIFAWLWSSAGLPIALLTLAHRICGVLLNALRLQVAFAALHTPVRFTDTLPFVLAALVGSASTIAPAGLGIGESLAALAATVTAFSPGVAFLAVGIDRLTCLTACAVTIAVARARQSRALPDAANTGTAG